MSAKIPRGPISMRWILLPMLAAFGLGPALAIAAEPHRIVFIIGENEYHTWETLPDFARNELEPRGLKCSFVTSSPKEGDNVFTNFTEIKEADLLFVSVRRRTPPKEMMALIRAHLQAGKPLAGIRTASHAFGAKPTDNLHEGWPAFDTEVLGCSYQNHYNNSSPGSPGTLVQILPDVITHPILAGISTNAFRVTSSLYKSRELAASVTPLMVGHVENQAAVEPVAWVNTDQDRRVFYTSLGSPDDFQQPFFRRLLLNAVFWSLNLAVPDPNLAPTPQRQDHALTPQQSLRSFTVPQDLQIDQVLAEPQVRQPVFLNFDERGRLWVVEFLQYPFPAGLKMLSHDNVWRAVYDKMPPPPPHHFPGADRITIYEDSGNGAFHKYKTFVEGLNIVTAAVKGRGGVWVLNPPYLLFYPDRNNDDIPDGDPEVRLSGFGLEDTHSVVNSLRWGPDGWLYACQGSTVTANVMRPGLDKEPIAHTMGQQIWRYHPETHRFEVFSEGGGNAFGCEIDDKGRIFSGHNGGNTRGFHYMQGAYLQKGFDKHGPLSNPYAFGYFPPMPHPAAERFTHNFIIYDGGALPAAYNGRLFGVEPLQGRIVESEISADGCSFTTRDLDYPVTTTDQWFRPVDIKVGPDGAIYIADWYDGQVNHYRNHQGQIDKSNGRIYRLKAKGAKPMPPFDLNRLSNLQLVDLLSNSNKWFRQQALRLLGDRKEAALVPLLSDMVRTNIGQLALESLWALNLSGGGLSESAVSQALNHPDPFVRLWAVRLVGDTDDISAPLLEKLVSLAATETNVEARAQLACSARRLPAVKDLRIVRALLAHDQDATEKRIPLLLWWAIEAKCETDRHAVLDLFREPAVWRLPLVKEHILERLMRRFAQAGSRRDLITCARLLELSPGPDETAKLTAGFETALQGGSLANLPDELLTALTKSGRMPALLGLRAGDPQALDAALKVVADPSASTQQRMQYLDALAGIKQAKALPVLLSLLSDRQQEALHPAALTALQQFDELKIGEEVLNHFDSFTEPGRAAALTLLSSRPSWALLLLKAVEAGRIRPESVSQDALQKIKTYSDVELGQLTRKLWGKERIATTDEMKQQISQFAAMIRNGAGDPYEGRKLFNMSCGLCHKLFAQGGQIGPDLTPYKRDDLDTLLLNVVNPSAEIREGYESYVVTTKDGRTLSGFLADKDNRVLVLRGVDGVNAVLPQDQIAEMKPTGVSLMPVGLLASLTAQQVRDLFAYLRSTEPLVGQPQRLSRAEN